jgi:hypothetical protein
MPVCTICRVPIRGPGTLCAHHRNTRYTYDRYNYSSDSTNPSSIHRRTGTHTRPRHAHFADNHAIYGQYDASNALVPYRMRGTAYNAHSNELAKPLIQVFDIFSDTHTIASAQYSANPSTGEHSLSAQANLDREQCTTCRQWFPDRYRLQYHQQEFPVECEQCSVCLRHDDIAFHATDVEHERCFVRSCESDYRRLGNWKHRYVERHILGRHH